MLIGVTAASIASPFTAINTTVANRTRSWPSFTETLYLISIFGFLSIVGTLFIFITFYLWKDIRSNSRKILMYISIADLLVVICHIAGVWYIPDLNACIVQAFVNIFAMMSSTFWTAAMAIYLYVTACRRQFQLALKMMAWFHIICWFVPLTMASFALTFGELGRSGFLGAAGWCWVRTYNPFKNEEKNEDYRPFHTPSHEEQVLWMILTDYLWKVVAFCIIIILYTLLKFKLREAMTLYSSFRDQSERRAYEAAAESERKLMLVPLLYVFLYIWSFIRFLVFVFNKDLIYHKNMTWLTALQGVGSTSQGFTNFLFYCFLTK